MHLFCPVDINHHVAADNALDPAREVVAHLLAALQKWNQCSSYKLQVGLVVMVNALWVVLLGAPSIVARLERVLAQLVGEASTLALEGSPAHGGDGKVWKGTINNL